MKFRTIISGGIIALVAAGGCSLITAVDRDKIPADGTGGTGTGGTGAGGHAGQPNGGGGQAGTAGGGTGGTGATGGGGSGGSTGGTGGTGATGGGGATGGTGGTGGQGGSGCVPTGPEVCDLVDNDCNGETDEGCFVVTIKTDTCHVWIHTDGSFNIIAADSTPDGSVCWNGTKTFFVQAGDRLLIWDDDASEQLDITGINPATIAVRAISTGVPDHTTMLDDLQNGTFSTGAPVINVVDLGGGKKEYTITHNTGSEHEWKIVF